MRRQDPDRSVDTIRNVLADEAWVASMMTEIEGDPLVYAEFYGRLIAVHRVARRLGITLPEDPRPFPR